MSKNATSGQESDESVDEQRARWERFSMTVLDGEGGGYVNVRNDSHGDEADAHIYSVEVEDGAATGCSCPHATHRGAHCKHQVAVEARPLVVSSATAAGASPSTTMVATDGGEVVDEENQADEREGCVECGSTVGETHEKYGGRCALCGVKALRDPDHPLERDREDTDDEPEAEVGRGEVVGSEAPDYGRGPSGVDEL